MYGCQSVDTGRGGSADRNIDDPQLPCSPHDTRCQRRRPSHRDLDIDLQGSRRESSSTGRRRLPVYATRRDSLCLFDNEDKKLSCR